MEAAKRELDRAVALSPRAAEILTWRGIAEDQLTQYDAAAADFRTALELNDGLLSARYNLALSLIRLRDIDGAITELRKVVSAQPDAPEPVYHLGVLLAGKGLSKEAAAALARAHAMRPSDAAITLRLLQAQLDAGEQAELAPLLVELGSATTAPALQQQAGAALLKSGRSSEAVALLEAARVHGVSTPESNLVLVRAMTAAGRGAEALALEQDLYRHDPGDPALALELARVLLVNDRADQAVSLFRSLPDTLTVEGERDILLGIALAATHEFSDSIVHLQRAIISNPKLPLADSVLGFVFLRRVHTGRLQRPTGALQIWILIARCTRGMRPSLTIEPTRLTRGCAMQSGRMQGTRETRVITCCWASFC